MVGADEEPAGVLAVLLGPAGREERMRLAAVQPVLLIAVTPGDAPSPIDSLTGAPPLSRGMAAEFVLEGVADGVATYRFARWT